jgi:hypothetical protein
MINLLWGYKTSLLAEGHPEKVIYQIFSESYQFFLFSLKGGDVLCANPSAKKVGVVVG